MPDAAPPPSHDEAIRRSIVRWVFFSFNAFSFAVLIAMVFRGWELSPATSSVIMLVLGTHVAAVSGTVGYYLGGVSAIAKTSSKDNP